MEQTLHHCLGQLMFRTVFMTVYQPGPMKNLNLNQAKCKFMFISRKRNSVLCLKPLQLNGVVLDSVQSFKYLGVMLTSDMSWSAHVSMVCSRARKILGVIYRQFYANATSTVLLQLYLSMVRPHVEYAAAVWSPHLKKDIALIEGVQKFALRMVFGAWGASYHHLLFLSNQLTLEDKRLVMKLSVLYQILDGSWHFQPGIFLDDKSLRHHSLNERTLVEPFCRTNCFRYSFVPSSIALWNNLQDIIVSADSLQLYSIHVCTVHNVTMYIQPIHHTCGTVFMISLFY